MYWRLLSQQWSYISFNFCSQTTHKVVPVRAVSTLYGTVAICKSNYMFWRAWNKLRRDQGKKRDHYLWKSLTGSLKQISIFVHLCMTWRQVKDLLLRLLWSISNLNYLEVADTFVIIINPANILIDSDRREERYELGTVGTFTFPSRERQCESSFLELNKIGGALSIVNRSTMFYYFLSCHVVCFRCGKLPRFKSFLVWAVVDRSYTLPI